MKLCSRCAFQALLLGFAVAAASTVLAAGDAQSGTRLFRSCAACHSLEPGRHLTGPSLAGIWGKEAGSVEGFNRYSNALAESQLVWGERTLDAWLTDPQATVPGNLMTFPGIKNPEARADLIAFLEQATGGPPDQRTDDRGAGSGGMMRAPALTDLKAVSPRQRVTAIRYCDDSYWVSTEAGRTFPFWEFNLRFKTDSSDMGPQPEHPVIVRAGMMGDRVFIVFSNPAEISAFIREGCD